MNRNSHLLVAVCIAFIGLMAQSYTAEIAYIYGDIDIDGDYPGDADYTTPFHQMLLTDTGKDGCSMLKDMIEEEGHTITQQYDVEIDMGLSFLNQFDVLIFGLHQRVWSNTEWIAIDTWLRGGGSIFMYSDSAAGGRFDMVPGGIANTVGQDAVNSILSHYGMQVTIDNGGGTRGYASDITSPLDIKDLVLEGEGVSPIAVDVEGTSAIALIPLSPDNLMYESRDKEMPHDTRNITINNPTWACLAYNGVGNGKVVAMFDRQPMWNNGGGSNIQQADNMEILRRVVNFLAADADVTEPIPPVVSFEQPAGDLSISAGESVHVIADANDVADNGTVVKVVLWIKNQTLNTAFQRIAVDSETPYEWGREDGENDPGGLLRNMEAGTYLLRAIAYDNDNESAFTQFTLRVAGSGNTVPVIESQASSSESTILFGESAMLSVVAAAENPLTYTWSKVSGSGDVTFSPNATEASAITEAVFSEADDYVLSVSISDGLEVVTSDVSVSVMPANPSLPEVWFDSLTDGDSVLHGDDLVVTVRASDNGAIRSVELFVNEQTKDPITEGELTWNLGRLPRGFYTLKADAISNDGEPVSKEITIEIIGEMVPTSISFVEPNADLTVNVGAGVIVKADAVVDGTIAYVDLYLDDVLIETLTDEPFAFANVTFDEIGEYTLKLEVTDDNGVQGHDTRKITVIDGATAGTGGRSGDDDGGCGIASTPEGGIGTAWLIALCLLGLTVYRERLRYS